MAPAIWDLVEIMSRDELERLQVERLKYQLARVKSLVPFYTSLFGGIDPDTIRSISDLASLPFTNKQDLRDNYPFGLFATPMDKVVRIHASSGTTGKPTVVGYTAKDIQMWAGLVARALMLAGVTKNDIVQNAYGYGLFTGGLVTLRGREIRGCGGADILWQHLSSGHADARFRHHGTLRNALICLGSSRKCRQVRG